MKRIGSAVALLLVVVALMAAGRWVKEFIAVDHCLDNGGRWNGADAKCEMAAPL